MKIGVNSRIYQNSESGIPYYVKLLYANILKIDDINDYIFFQTNRTKVLGNTRTISLPNNLLGNSFFDSLLVNSLSARENIDVFHGTSFSLPLVRDTNVRYVLTIHDLAFLTFPEFYSRIYKTYFGFIVKRSLQNADTVVCDSECTRRDVLNFFNIPENKVKTVLLGVNETFLNITRKKSLINERYFFSITTHPKRKNILRVLKAMSASKLLREMKYVVAGLISKRHLEELFVVISDLNLQNNVIIRGYVSEEELISLYQNAEFMVYPSLYEGFGFPILEAMASYCPVISSNTSSLVELNSQVKWQINPDDTEEIMDKMERMSILSIEERSMLISANRKFAENFRWHKTANEMINIFNGN